MPRALARRLTRSEMEQEPVMSMAEAAATLGISYNTAMTLAARGELPTTKMGKRRLVLTKPLLALLDNAD